MICPNCGAPLPDTVSMCYSCRTVFKPENQQIKKPTQSKPMNYPAKQINQPNTSKSNDSLKRIKDIIIGLIIIVIAIYCLYMAGSYNNMLTP